MCSHNTETVFYVFFNGGDFLSRDGGPFLGGGGGGVPFFVSGGVGAFVLLGVEDSTFCCLGEIAGGPVFCGKGAVGFFSANGGTLFGLSVAGVDTVIVTAGVFPVSLD